MHIHASFILIGIDDQSVDREKLKEYSIAKALLGRTIFQFFFLFVLYCYLEFGWKLEICQFYLKIIRKKKKKILKHKKIKKLKLYS